MSKRFLRFAGLLVALVITAGIAWATVNAGTITNGDTTQTSDLNGSLADPAGTQAIRAYGLSGAVTLRSKIVLPTFVSNDNRTINDLNPDGSVSATRFITLDDPSNHLLIQVTNNELTLRPGLVPLSAGGNDNNAIAGPLASSAGIFARPDLGTNPQQLQDFNGSWMPVIGATDGALRLSGGITRVYAAADNAPSSISGWNSYGEGTFLRSGRMNIAHSNALGAGRIVLAEGSTMGFFDTNITLGATLPTGVSVRGVQYLQLNRNNADRNVATSISTAPVTFDVMAVADGTPLTFQMHSPITEGPNLARPTERPGSLIAAGPPEERGVGRRVQLVKDGPGTMRVSNFTTHTGGTEVRQGTLEILAADSSSRYEGELGLTWRTLPFVSNRGATEVVLPPIADSTDPARNPTGAYAPWWNYLNMQGVAPGNVSARAGAAGNITPGASDAITTLTHVGGTWREPNNNFFHHNSLNIAAGATLIVERDQVFDDLNGAGTFEVRRWIGNGREQIPQIIVRLNNVSSTFSGVLKGKMHLILNNGTPNTAGTSLNTLTLTGNNEIEDGETTIKDGTLSINSSKSLPPGVIRVGLNQQSRAHDVNGVPVTTGATTFFALPVTHRTATLHASQTIELTQPVVVRSAAGTTWMSNTATTDGSTIVNASFPNLAVERNATLSFRGQVDFRNEAGAGFTGGSGTVGNPNLTLYPFPAGDMFNNAIRINHTLGVNRNWLGTVSLASFDFPGSSPSRPLAIEIYGGMLHLEKPPLTGFGMIAVRPGTVLSLGENARDFTGKLDLHVFDDSRIRLVVRPGDLKSEENVRASKAIFEADVIDYTGMGNGERARDARLVIQLDLSQIPNSELQKDSWFKAVESINATNWNYLHFLRESSGTMDEDYPKIRVSYSGNETLDGEKIEAVLDQNSYSILIHIKETITPGPGTPGPGEPGPGPGTPAPDSTFFATPPAGAPTTAGVAGGSGVSFTFSVDTSKYAAGTAVTVLPTSLNWTASVVRADGTVTVTGSAPAASTNDVTHNFRFQAQQVDGNTYYSPTTNFVVNGTGGGNPGPGPGPGEPGDSDSSSSGCSTGFAGLALLLAAPLFLRKKD